MNTILIKAVMQSYRPKMTGDCSVTFNLPAITKKDLNILFDLQGMEGNLGFSKHEIQSSDIPKDDLMPDISSKSPSLRLKNVLFRVYMNNKNITDSKLVDQGDYLIYYTRVMEGIINQFKEKLPNQI